MFLKSTFHKIEEGPAQYSLMINVCLIIVGSNNVKTPHVQPQADYKVLSPRERFDTNNILP